MQDQYGRANNAGLENAALGWLRGPAVERRSLAGVLSLSGARPVADG